MKQAQEAVDRLQREAAKNGEKSVGAKTTTLVGITSNKRLAFFERYAPQISQLIPSRDDGMNAARIVQLAVQLTDNPKIAECHPKTIIGSVMQSVILGFEPIPGLGLAAFIPYAKNLTFQIMYQGLIDLAYRTDMYEAIYADVVRDGDEFEYWRGLQPGIVHKPKVYKGDITHCYAVAHLKGSSMPIFVVQTWEEIIEIRNRSAHGYNKPDSPWQTRPGEQGKKTVLKNLMKILPKSVVMQKAVASDERAIDVDDFSKDTKEPDYSKMAEDATFQDLPERKESKPKPESQKKKSSKYDDVAIDLYEKWYEDCDERERKIARAEYDRVEIEIDKLKGVCRHCKKPYDDCVCLKDEPKPEPAKSEPESKPVAQKEAGAAPTPPKTTESVLVRPISGHSEPKPVEQKIEELKQEKEAEALKDAPGPDMIDEMEASVNKHLEENPEAGTEGWGDDKEVEQTAKDNVGPDGPAEESLGSADAVPPDVFNKQESEIGDEKIKEKLDELKEGALLKDAYTVEKAKRKIKYLRECANDAREALAFYSDEKAPNGIHNLGELCAFFDVNAITSYDITVGKYKDIKTFIMEVKRQNTEDLTDPA